MNDLVYRGDTTNTYAMSIAATWIWAPAIFVASSTAYFNGIYGFLWFLIPNVLTLILFGYFSQKFIKEKYQESFVNINDIFIDNDLQKTLHSIISGILLISSTCVQLIGLNLLLKIYFPEIPISISVFTISFFCYVYTKFGGIKTCIVSDKYKYIVMLFFSIILLISSVNTIEISEITLFGVNNSNFIDISLSFGIITAIGLFSAPYVDNTFWQRVFSIKKEFVFKTFIISSLFFMIIPMIFGIIGIISTNEYNASWEITNLFNDNLFLTICLTITIFFALIATIDSNLCGIYSLTSKMRCKNISMEVMLCASCLIVIIFEPTILQMFLIYGTIRTAIAIPTILLIYKKYNKKRLFYVTLIASVVGSVGYIIVSTLNLTYGYIFTIFAFSFPILGYSKYET